MAAICNALQRPQAGRTDLDAPAGNREQVARQIARDQAIEQRQRVIDKQRADFQATYLTDNRSKLPTEVVAAFRESAGKRSDTQKRLVQQHQTALDAEITAALPDATRTEIAELQRQQQALRLETPDLPRGYFYTEPQPNPPVTNVLLRGKAGAPGAVADPGFPKVLIDKQPEFGAPQAPTSLRRLTLARWIASRDNPLAARVIVNRIWQLHFGDGLVRTPSDFGVMGYPPTHPELLEWLADWFVNEGEWSLKRLHRLILTSNAFQMSKAWNAEYGAKDPTNEKLWRMSYRRLEVEPLCDSMLAISGQLNRQMGGPSMYPFIPRQAMEGHSDPMAVWKPFDERDASRRTVYAFVKRSLVVPLLEVLDLCDTTRSAAQRTVTSVAPQALAMLNGDFVNRQASHFAQRLEREAGNDRCAQIKLAWRLAFCREADDREIETMLQFLDETARQPAVVSADKPSELGPHGALVQMCRAIFNLNEFAYSD